MDLNLGRLPAALTRTGDDVEAWRARAERAERALRAACAQRDILAAVIRQLLDGANPEMVAAVEDRTARATAAAAGPQHS